MPPQYAMAPWVSAVFLAQILSLFVLFGLRANRQMLKLAPNGNLNYCRVKDRKGEMTPLSSIIHI